MYPTFYIYLSLFLCVFFQHHFMLLKSKPVVNHTFKSISNKKVNRFKGNFVVHLLAFLTVTATIVSFSIRVFSIAAVICTVLVLPVNYYGRDTKHTNIGIESLEVFTIENVNEGSKWYGLYLLSVLKC